MKSNEKTAFLKICVSAHQYLGKRPSFLKVEQSARLFKVRNNDYENV